MHILPPEEAFLGLPAEDSVDYSAAQAVVIPFGLEASVSYQGGTAQGPSAMLEASQEVELFDESLMCEPFRQIGIVTLPEPQIESPLPRALEQLEAIVTQVLDDNKFPLTFGGEHSITAGTIRPFAKRYPNLVILHFDAHADLRDGYEGEHYSHASALRRCMDFPNIELISVGIRNISQSEMPFLQANQHRIHMHWAKDRRHWDLSRMAAVLKDRPIYLTFDVDGFDASLMPATGTPEPGGLFWEDAMDWLSMATQAGYLVGADINELAPIPQLHSCDFVAAKLAYKILAMTFCQGKRAAHSTATMQELTSA